MSMESCAECHDAEDSCALSKRLWTDDGSHETHDEYDEPNDGHDGSMMNPMMGMMGP